MKRIRQFWKWLRWGRECAFCDCGITFAEFTAVGNCCPDCHRAGCRVSKWSYA